MKIEWHPKIPIIVGLIHILYDIKPTGGLCHIVTDDNNIRDEHLQWTIEHCEQPENKKAEDCELSSLICKLLLQLDINQRACLFMMMDDDWPVISEDQWEVYTDIISEENIKEYLFEG